MLKKHTLMQMIIISVFCFMVANLSWADESNLSGGDISGMHIDQFGNTSVINSEDLAEGGNDALITQSGIQNTAMISQIGNGNFAHILQNGIGNSARIVQQGAGNHARIVQTGSGNTAVINQGG